MNDYSLLNLFGSFLVNAFFIEYSGIEGGLIHLFDLSLVVRHWPSFFSTDFSMLNVQRNVGTDFTPFQQLFVVTDYLISAG